jgi:hypothetical protein
MRTDAFRNWLETLAEADAVVPARKILERLAALVGAPEPAVTAATPLTVEQLAERLGRSPSTVRGWLGQGLFPNAFKLRDREWRIPVGDIAAFLAGASKPVQDQQEEQGKGFGSDDLGSWRKHMRKAS